MDDNEIKCRLVEKMLRKDITGSKDRTVDAVVNMMLPSHEQGRGKQLLDDMAADRDAPILKVGGSRGTVKLTSEADAVQYLKDNGGDVPFGFD